MTDMTDAEGFPFKFGTFGHDANATVPAHALRGDADADALNSVTKDDIVIHMRSWYLETVRLGNHRFTARELELRKTYEPSAAWYVTCVEQMRKEMADLNGDSSFHVRKIWIIVDPRTADLSVQPALVAAFPKTAVGFVKPPELGNVDQKERIRVTAAHDWWTGVSTSAYGFIGGYGTFAWSI